MESLGLRLAMHDLLVHSPLTTFSALALSKSPFSIALWSGLRRESVGATASSISLREHTNSVKPYISSLPGLWRERKEEGWEGRKKEGVGREEGVRGGREEGMNDGKRGRQGGMRKREGGKKEGKKEKRKERGMSNCKSL